MLGYSDTNRPIPRGTRMGRLFEQIKDVFANLFDTPELMRVLSNPRDHDRGVHRPGPRCLH